MKPRCPKTSMMVVVAGIIGFSGALYAIGEIGRVIWRKGYATFFFLLLAGINGAFLTNDLFNLFVWFEVMLMSSFAMLVLGRGKYVFEGATKYVVINMVSSFFFLSGLGVLPRLGLFPPGLAFGKGHQFRPMRCFQGRQSRSSVRP